MNFNALQKKIIMARDEKILCLSSAASGKTRVLTERIRVLVEDEKVAPSDIVAITFTNMAADEMKKRLGEVSTNMFIGTIHSYANKICSMNNFDTQSFINSKQFDKIITQALKISDMKYPKIQHLLIDECQDLSELEFTFLNKIPTKNIFFVGDTRQCIYSFRGSSDEFLISMYDDPAFKKYYLTDNYRNAPNIITFAEDFLRSSRPIGPNSIPVKKKNGIVEECGFVEALQDLKSVGNWGSWFILTRTNAELEEVQERLDDENIPNVTFKKGDLDMLELETLMASDKVKVLTIHSSKGMERKNVIVVGAKTYNEEERRIAYVAATRAENALYWCPTVCKRFAKRKKKTNLFNNSSVKMIEF